MGGIKRAAAATGPPCKNDLKYENPACCSYSLALTDIAGSDAGDVRAEQDKETDAGSLGFVDTKGVVVKKGYSEDVHFYDLGN
ncbi:hypothetical protein V502_06559 [Pseudogymnoascus sp. VKM F-4520 (FW-2644)]|nr:hypothetical protein V502_06559 [Pseudogymnoascus sp. VKM F-4520 (FW-2644)]